MFKIFVGNLNFTTTEDAIRRLFSRHAEVEDVALPLDPETGKHRGFAIVMIKDDMRAKGAMIALRGTRLDGRALVINQARKKGEAPPKKERRTSSRYRSRGSRPGGRGSSSGYGGGDRGGPGAGDGSQRSFGARPNWRPGGDRPSSGNRDSPRPSGPPGGRPPSRPRDDE